MDHQSEHAENYSDLLMTSHALEVVSEQKWDTIVIGSGMGGLAAAGILAKAAGEKVLILEKHTKVGGCTHEFTEKGLVFDTGLHYVGAEVWKEESLARKVFDYITDSRLEWSRLDDVFDVAVVKGGEQYNFRSGITKQQRDLEERFPEAKTQLAAYWKDVEKESARFAGYIQRHISRAYFPSFLVPSDKNFGQETVAQALDRLQITDETLREVLTYLHGDYGATPEEASWVEHCMVVAHYSNGAAYPVGGSGQIARDVLRVVEKSGGRAATRAAVESLLIENGSCQGVVVRGKQIRAGKVISAVGAFHTFTKLVPKDLESKHPFLLKARRELESEKLKPSPSHAMTFLALRGSAKDLGLPKANWWINDDSKFPSVFISFPSAKDPTWNEMHPDQSVCEIVVEAPYELFEQYSKEPVKGRSEEYKEMKDNLADEMCRVLFKHFPQLKDKILFRDASTPLSAEHFLGSKKGCAYGLACVPVRYRAEWLQPATGIPNLYLGAQDIVSCGIVGSLMGGITCASACSTKAMMHFAHLTYFTPHPITQNAASLNDTLQDEVDVSRL